MPTFGELKTRVANKLNLPSTDSASLARIGNAINGAIDFYEEKHLWFNEATAQFTTTASNPDLTPLPAALPSDYLYEWEQAGLVLTENNTKYIIKKITHQDQISIDNSNTESRPRFYTFTREKIYLYPVPDKGYTVDLYYIKSYPNLTSDSQSNDWTNNADRLIEAKALADMYLDDRHGIDMANRYEQKAEQELRRLQTRSKKGIATGELTINSLTFDSGNSNLYRMSLLDY